MLDGMHADMLVISILTFLTSLVGLPWLVAATVRSISHVRALSIFDSAGKLKETIEQRVTGLSIHSLIGSLVLFDGPRKILSQIPTPVLMGLFLFLGTSALPGNEMWERMKGKLIPFATAVWVKKCITNYVHQNAMQKYSKILQSLRRNGGLLFPERCQSCSHRFKWRVLVLWSMLKKVRLGYCSRLLLQC